MPSQWPAEEQHERPGSDNEPDPHDVDRVAPDWGEATRPVRMKRDRFYLEHPEQSLDVGDHYRLANDDPDQHVDVDEHERKPNRPEIDRHHPPPKHLRLRNDAVERRKG